MPATIFPVFNVPSLLNRAFHDQSPSNAVFISQLAAAGTTRESSVAFAIRFGADFVGLTEDQLSTLILGNLGLLPNTGLQTAVKDYLVSVGKANVGVVAMQLGEILSGLEYAIGDQAIYNAAALAWNDEVTASYNYSANPNHTGPSPVGPIGPRTGPAVWLTAGDDRVETRDYDDTFLATTAGWLSSTDVVDGGAGADTLKAALAAAAVVAPQLKGIEKVFITAGAAAEFSAAGATGLAELWVDAAAGAATFSGVNLATAVGIQNSGAGGALTVNFAGAAGPADSARIVFADATGKDEVIVNAIETLNVKSTAGTVAATTVNNARITAAQAEKIVITGDQALTTTVTGAKVTVIDASALTQALGLTLAAAGGSGVAVTINAQAAHKITLGGGADTLNIAGLAGTAAKDLDIGSAATLAASAIAVTDFASGTDMLKLSAGAATAKAAPTGTELASIAASSSLLDAASMAATTAGANKAIAFRYGADTFILVNDATAALGANDSLVKLTGVAELADASWVVA